MYYILNADVDFLDIYVVSHDKGSIDIKNFNGDQIILNANTGSISADSCKNTKIDIRSSKGNITTLGTLQAADIFIQSKHKAVCIYKLSKKKY